MIQENTPGQEKTEPRQTIFQEISGRLFSPHPSITDVGKMRRAQLAATLSFILTIFLGFGILFGPTSLATFLIIFTIALLSYLLSRTKYYLVSAFLLTFGLLANAFLPLYLGTATNFLTSVYAITPLAFILANALLPTFGQVLLTLVGVLAIALSPLYSDMVPPDLVASTTGTIMTFGLILIGLGSFRTNTENLRLEETRQINRELEDIKTSLEERVTERTKELVAANEQTTKRAEQLRLVAEVARSATSLQELELLLTTITDLISQRFNIYHTGIFLLDENLQYALLRAANSEGGKRMLERGHRLRVGEQGIVGYVASTGHPRIALDVGVDAVYFDNPDMPETRSEMALPLSIAGQIIGALDLQSKEQNAFLEEDVDILSIMADQVTVAIQNARLFEDLQDALERVEATRMQETSQIWQRYIVSENITGYIYDGFEPKPINQNFHEKSVHKKEYSIPLKLRGQTIGHFYLNANDPKRKWTADELALAQTAAERTALALESARLLEDAQRRATKERTISEGTSRVSAALDVESILEFTAEELERALGSSEVLIQLESDE
jgi:GAF domain-containing protein